MTEVSRERVRQLLGELADARRRMGRLAELEEEEFLSDFRNRDSAKYLFIAAIEAAIDVCNHFAASLGGRAPRDYADCFGILAELEVVPAELAERLAPLARFRNLLVHLYWKVDDRRVYRILTGEASDLDDFRRAVVRWTERREEGDER